MLHFLQIILTDQYMLPSGELIGMFHMIDQVTLKQYDCPTCAAYKVGMIYHPKTLTGGVTLTPFYYYMYVDFS